MSIANVLPATGPEKSRRPGRVLIALILLEILVLWLPPLCWGYLALALLGIVLLIAVAWSVLYERATMVLLGWVLLFPLGYYFLSFPREHTLLNLDRLVITLLLVAASFADGAGATSIPPGLRKSAWLWIVFVFFAASTLPRVKDALSGIHIIVESFLFPAILAWFVLRYFDVRKNLRALHVCACIMAIYVGAIGFAEVITQQDLLALPDSAVIMAGDAHGDVTQLWLRPNGPFSSTNSFALIGLVNFFFLSFLKRAMTDPMSSWRRLLHRLGMLFALMTAFLPLFRSVMTSLVVIILIDAFYHRGRRRYIRLAAISGIALLGLVMQLALPEILQDRTDPENVYGRIAEQAQTLKMFADNPVNGVGINNFYEAAQQEKYVTYYNGVQSVDFPHNNLGAVLAETGLTGFTAYVVSQVLLVLAFRSLRRRGGPSASLVWKTFLFIFLAYWINGLSLTSGYYSDLNLWYMFALGIVYKYGCTDSRFSSCAPRVALPISNV